jgi:hypothetical protein
MAEFLNLCQDGVNAATCSGIFVKKNRDNSVQRAITFNVAMTSHLIVTPYRTLLKEFHSHNVTDGMAVPKVVRNNMAKHAAHNDDDDNCWPRGYNTQDNPGGANYLGFCFHSLKAVNPPFVPI